MNEKKVCKIDDEAMKKVAGGQGDNSTVCEDTLTPAKILQKYEDPGVVYLSCPECGGNLNIMTMKGSVVNGKCPHCQKMFTVTA